MKGMRRRPALRKVKMTSESSLNAIMDVKHKYESVDFKANLKTVRKDDEKVSKAIASADLYSNEFMTFKAFGAR